MFLKANDLQFHVKVKGSGEPLLFLGGSMWDMRSHSEPIFAALADAFQVCIFDQRGLGQTDKPAGPYSMQQYADDASAIMDMLNWDSAHIVGYSFGGMVAQEFGIHWPDKTRKLVLCASSPGGTLGSSFPIEKFQKLKPFERAKRGLEVADKRNSLAFQKTNKAVFDARIKKRMETEQILLNSCEAEKGLLALLEARSRHDTSWRIHKIVSQTLILKGAFDGQAPEWGQEQMAQLIPNAQIKTVQGGHNFIFENNGCFEAIRDFCKPEV